MLKLKEKNKKLIFRAVKIAVIILLLAVTLGLLAPIYFVIIRSLAPAEDMFPMNALPEAFYVQHFAELFNGTGELGLPFSRYFFHTLAVFVITAALQIPIVTAMAYVLAKVKAPGVKILNTIIEWTLILSPAVLYVPQYFLLLKIGISNSLFAMILPFMASPLAVFLMKKYISAIPDEMIDSAKIDGASHFRICFGFVMPNIKPACLTLIALLLGNSWSYSGELFVQSAEVKPLGSLLQRFSESEQTAGLFCALAVILSVPLLIFAVICRKEIARTVSLAGIKNETGLCKTEKK